MSTALEEKMSRLGPGWLPSYNYKPAYHCPWHLQHPSLIENDKLMETCDHYDSIFPYGDSVTFEPKNTPWWTHWLIAFAVRKTTLSGTEICLLYKYKYRDVILDIDRLQVRHIVNDFWDYLRDGEHAYAFEWERGEIYEDSLRDLLSVWLSEAYRPQSWQSEERRLRWLSFGYSDRVVDRGEASSDHDFEGVQSANNAVVS